MPAKRKPRPKRKTWGQRFLSFVEPKQAATLALAALGIVSTRHESNKKADGASQGIAALVGVSQEALDRADSLRAEVVVLKLRVRTLEKSTQVRAVRVGFDGPEAPIEPYGPPAPPTNPFKKLWWGIINPFRGR